MGRKFYAVENSDNELDWVVATEPEATYFWAYNWDDKKIHRNRPLWKLFRTNLDPYPEFKQITAKEGETLIANNYQEFTRDHFSDLEFWDAETRTFEELVKAHKTKDSVNTPMTADELAEFIDNAQIVISEPSDDILAENKLGSGFTAEDLYFLEEMGWV